MRVHGTGYPISRRLSTALRNRDSALRAVYGSGFKALSLQLSLLNESRALSGSSLSPLRAAQEALIEIEIAIGIEIENSSAIQVSSSGGSPAGC
jgi:hypothetical protein